MKCQALLIDSPCLQINRPVDCECSAALRDRAHSASRRKIHRCSGHEEHHANVAEARNNDGASVRA